MYVLVYVDPASLQQRAVAARNKRIIMAWAGGNLPIGTKWRLFCDGDGWCGESDHDDIFRLINHIPPGGLILTSR